MKNALAATMSGLSEVMRRSLTWDRSKELSAHAQFKIETGIPVFFADHTVPGSAARTKPPTACSGSTSRREPTCRVPARYA